MSSPGKLTDVRGSRVGQKQRADVPAAGEQVRKHVMPAVSDLTRRNGTPPPWPQAATAPGPGCRRRPALPHQEDIPFHKETR